METKLESVLTTSMKSATLSYIEDHPESKEELITLSISNKQPYAWKAAWYLGYLLKKNDPEIIQHVETILEILPKRNESQQRELLKILLTIDIDEEFEGRLFDLCIEFWQNPKKPPAIRYYAFKQMYKTASRHPDLTPELLAILGPQYLDSLTPGIGASIRKMVRHLL